MNADSQTRAVNATVRIVTSDRGNGQGVLVPGGLILTAAHCVDWDHEGAMVLREDLTQEIKTAKDKALVVAPYAVEPVRDIAVFGAPDIQLFWDQYQAFDEFCESTIPVPVFSAAPDKPFDIYIWSHEGYWINALATPTDIPGELRFEKADRPINGGTSGGPIVNDKGELVGIVSNAGGNVVPGDGSVRCFDGTFPSPHLALPGWVWNVIQRASVGE